MLPNSILKRLNKYVSLTDINYSQVETIHPENIQPTSNIVKLGCIINIEKANNIKRINKFHKKVFEFLGHEGIYVSCVETITQRKIKFKNEIPFGFKSLFLIIDFIFKRVIPKLPLTKQLYFAITHGHNRVLSKAEALGRLSSCGFKVLDTFCYKNRLYIIALKTFSSNHEKKPSYGPLISLERVGFNKKIIKIYKFRTMHPYSEFIQEDVFNDNKLNSKGKLKNDFRLTNWGKVLRKYWIDELPQILNLIKGDIRLVGPRALSEHYFSLYPKEVQDMRTACRPGLIPPYYADMPNSFDEIIESEKLFLIKKKNKPVTTAFIYFFKSIFNIIIKGARSS